MDNVTQTVSNPNETHTISQADTQTQVQPNDVDLVSRVSQVEPEQGTPEITAPKMEDFKFDYSQLNSLKTPEEVQRWAEDAYKSFQKGFNSKYQQLAEERKKIVSSDSQPISTEWTSDRVQALMQDKSFIDAAKGVLGQQGQTLETQDTGDDYSYYDEAESKKLKQIEQQMAQLQNQNYQLAKQREDEVLRGKYNNYNPQAIDTFTNDMLTGKYNVTREDIFKAMDYEDALKRAYRLGQTDGQTGIKEKVQSSSIETGTQVPASDVPEKQQNESNESYFKRLFFKNMQARKNDTSSIQA